MFWRASNIIPPPLVFASLAVAPLLYNLTIFFREVTMIFVATIVLRVIRCLALERRFSRVRFPFHHKFAFHQHAGLEPADGDLLPIYRDLDLAPIDALVKRFQIQCSPLVVRRGYQRPPWQT